MVRGIAIVALSGIWLLSSCAKKETAEAPPPAVEAPAVAPVEAPAVGGPRAVVHLKSGATVPGTIVASSRTDMVVAGDDGIEKKIPMSQVKSVEYGDAKPVTERAKPARFTDRDD